MNLSQGVPDDAQRWQCGREQVDTVYCCRCQEGSRRGARRVVQLQCGNAERRRGWWSCARWRKKAGECGPARGRYRSGERTSSRATWRRLARDPLAGGPGGDALARFFVPEAIKHRQGKTADQARALTTDAEATVLKMSDGGFRFFCNPQLASDVDSLVTVSFEVATIVRDQGQMVLMIEQVRWRNGLYPAVQRNASDLDSGASSWLSRIMRISASTFVLWRVRWAPHSLQVGEGQRLPKLGERANVGLLALETFPRGGLDLGLGRCSGRQPVFPSLDLRRQTTSSGTLLWSVASASLSISCTSNFHCASIISACSYKSALCRKLLAGRLLPSV